MRDIKQLIIHCSYTKPGMDIGAKEIRQWHTDPKPRGNGWSDIGYHYVIRRNGKLEYGRAEETVGAHVAGHNAHSIGICLVGGMSEKGIADCNFTYRQYQQLRRLVTNLGKRYPDAELLGHRDIPGVSKSCPVFDVRAFFDAGES